VHGEDLAYAGIARQAELLKAREVSSRELTELYLERIGRIDADLNAYRAVWGERALAEADQADGRLGAGEERPLLGVPIALKDNVDVVGEVTTHGTSAYSGSADADSEVVRRLRTAGAVILGTTNLPELALWGFTETATNGITRNPWDRDRTTGGSSGGSGAATAAGLCAAALGSDGAGSIRIPAASCGLFGLKPQRGRVSLAPLAEHWFGLSVIGCLTRGVLDSALFLDAVAGSAPGDADTPPAPERPFADSVRSAPGRLRIGWSASAPMGVPVDEQVRGGVEATAEALESLGHSVEPHEPWVPVDVMSPVLPRYWGGAAEDADALPHAERLERRTRHLVAGGRVLRRFVPRARRLEEEARPRVLASFERHDVLMTPVTARLPAPVLWLEGRGAIDTFTRQALAYPFTVQWNVAGLPAASVPAGFSRDGLPLAVQLIGRPNDEGTLLSLAAQLEAERPWAERRPPVG
jgi:amidase